MSETHEEKKISADQLYEEALDWWDTLDGPDINQRELIIAKAYMEAHGIKEEQINW